MAKTDYHVYTFRVPRELHERLKQVVEEETRKTGEPVALARVVRRFIVKGLGEVGKKS